MSAIRVWTETCLSSPMFLTTPHLQTAHAPQFNHQHTTRVTSVRDHWFRRTDTVHASPLLPAMSNRMDSSCAFLGTIVFPVTRYSFDTSSQCLWAELRSAHTLTPTGLVACYLFIYYLFNDASVTTGDWTLVAWYRDMLLRLSSNELKGICKEAVSWTHYLEICLEWLG